VLLPPKLVSVARASLTTLTASGHQLDSCVSHRGQCCINSVSFLFSGPAAPELFSDDFVDKPFQLLGANNRRSISLGADNQNSSSAMPGNRRRYAAQADDGTKAQCGFRSELALMKISVPWRRLEATAIFFHVLHQVQLSHCSDSPSLAADSFDISIQRVGPSSRVFSNSSVGCNERNDTSDEVTSLT
jgi:hypothetical protein